MSDSFADSTRNPKPNSRERDNQPLQHETPSGLDDSKEALVWDPLNSRADIAKAEKHAKARRVGRLKETESQNLDYCEDCGLPANNELIDLCSGRIELADLGAGFPLYYEYIVFCMVLLVLLFALVGIQGMVANHQGEICNVFKILYEPDDEDYCKGGFLIEYGLSNRSSKDSWKVSNILSLIFVCIGVLAGFYYRRIQGLTADEANRGSTTPSDYAVMVKGLPETEKADKIKAFFEQFGKKNGRCVVKKVIMSYYIADYVKLMKERTSLYHKKIKGDTSAETEAAIKDIEKKMDDFEAHISEAESKKFTGIAFIVFNTQLETNEVIQKFKMTQLEKAFSFVINRFCANTRRSYNGHVIKVDRAPEPFDVFWENLGLDWWEVAKKRVLTNIVSVLLLAVTFGLILGISALQNVIRGNTTSQVGITILSAVCSFIVNVINSALGIFIRKLSAYEKHQTYTYYFMSVANKLSYAQFVNTAIITLLVQIVITENDVKLWTRNSLVSGVFFLYLLNAFVPSASYYFNPFYIIRIFKRGSVRSAAADPNSKFTQNDANSVFEGPPVDMAQRYANVQKTMLFTAFYASVVPVGILFSIAGLIITYWTDKYLLLRRHCRPNALGKELAEDMADFLELFFVSLTAGNLIFEKIHFDETSGLNWIAFIISVVAFLLPQNILASCIMAEENTISHTNKDYDVVKWGFMAEYDRLNPITQEQAMKEWFEEMAKMDPEMANQQYGKSNTTDVAQHIPQAGQPRVQALTHIPQFARKNPYGGAGNFQQQFGPNLMQQFRQNPFQNQMMMMQQNRPQFVHHLPQMGGFVQPRPMMNQGPPPFMNQPRIIPQAQHFPQANMSNNHMPPQNPHFPQNNPVPIQNNSNFAPNVQPQQVQIKSHFPQQQAPINSFGSNHILPGPQHQQQQQHIPQNRPMGMPMGGPQMMGQPQPMMGHPQPMMGGQPMMGQPQMGFSQGPGFQQPPYGFQGQPQPQPQPQFGGPQQMGHPQGGMQARSNPFGGGF